MNLTAAQTAKAVGGTIRAGNGLAPILGVSTDSRSIEKGELFVALRGPRFDGHDYVMNACRKGAAGALVETTGALAETPDGFNVIEVADTLTALGGLASYVRSLYNTRLAAITGTAGKTTVKEMAAAILSRSRKILKNEGNMNNLIGLPLTLLRLEEGHEAAVVELGISEPGEMERLVEICRPDVALITNMGRGHTGTLGGAKGVARAKGALFAGLGEGAVKAVNLDDERVVEAAGLSGEMTTFSARADAIKADVRATDWFTDPGITGMNVLYDVRGSSVSVHFDTPLEANVINGAGAIAVALAFGARLEDVREGLCEYRPGPGRMDVVVTGGGGITLLDDTYNANPDSTAAALRTLSRAAGRKIAVLGDMLELGDEAASAHREAGALAAGLGVDLLLAVGEFSSDMAAGAEGAGLGDCTVMRLADRQEAAAALAGLLERGDTVLVKASRALRFEEIVEGLKAGDFASTGA